MAEKSRKAAGNGGRIDVHYHICPPAWGDAMATRHRLNAVFNNWSVAKAIEDMDRDGVERSICSITIPGVWLGSGEESRRLARQCNDFAAKMRQDHPGRFGFFAALPLPDTDGSLRELAYALDELKADGIGLLTSYDGKWLGDPSFQPVFDELNRRKAIVYTHPIAPQCCMNLIPGVTEAIIEYGTDTSRSIAQLVVSGLAVRYGDARFIWSHAGGTLPFLVERLVVAARNPRSQMREDPLASLRRFYYDTAQAAMAPPMAALKQVAPVPHILFGTDYPYRTAAEHVDELRQSKMFNAREIAMIERGNALELLGA